MFRAMGALCAFTRHTVVGGNVYPHRFFSIKMGRYWTHSHSAPGVNDKQQLASDVDTDEKSQAPGIGMKLTVAGICQKFSTVKHISTGRLSNWMKQAEGQTEGQSNTGTGNLVILDTRLPEEYETGHIPGSVHVNFKSDAEEIIANVPQLQEAGEFWMNSAFNAGGQELVQSGPMKVVCYCSIGVRGSMVAQKLEHMFVKHGTSDRKSAYNLSGSIFQWANEGRPMIDGNNQPTIYAHPFNAVFGKFLRRELRKTE